MKAQELRNRIQGAWLCRADGWWIRLDLARVRDVARVMRDGGARFGALTVRPEGSALKCAWHWDASGVLLSMEALADPQEAVPSIVDLWPGADWAEREARDYYAVSFAGREATPPLMLREGDDPGVLLPGRNGARP